MLALTNTSFLSDQFIWKFTECPLWILSQTLSHALGTKSMVATLVPGLGKCQEGWKYFLEGKEKIMGLGAWHIAGSHQARRKLGCMCALRLMQQVAQMPCGTG